MIWRSSDQRSVIFAVFLREPWFPCFAKELWLDLRLCRERFPESLQGGLLDGAQGPHRPGILHRWVSG